MKGQTQQVFIYIMVILVVGGVLIFGYKSINNIMNKSCEVDHASFQAQLKNILEDNTGYGDISPIAISAPCAYEQLCFLDSIKANITVGQITNELIKQEVQQNTGNNVFVVKGDKVIPLYSLDYLVVPGVDDTHKGFICINSKGNKFYFVLEGIGKGKVQISSRN